jgi:hypothetical protein
MRSSCAPDLIPVLEDNPAGVRNTANCKLWYAWVEKREQPYLTAGEDSPKPFPYLEVQVQIPQPEIDGQRVYLGSQTNCRAALDWNAPYLNNPPSE